MICDLMTENLDHSAAQLLKDTSYIVDPAGQRRSIVVTKIVESTEEQKSQCFRFTFVLDDKGEPFGPGTYTIHLELKEKGKVYTYHGEWKIEVGLGTPL